MEQQGELHKCSDQSQYDGPETTQYRVERSASPREEQEELIADRHKWLGPLIFAPYPPLARKALVGVEPTCSP